MAWDPVQDEYLVLREPNPVQIQGDDLYCKGKVLVLEQETALKNAVNKVELRGRVCSRPLAA